MYNKIKELCCALKIMNHEELFNNGIRSIMIFSIGTDLSEAGVTKGDLHDILSILGEVLEHASKISGVPLKRLCDTIYETETILEQLMKEKEGD